jgi:versiconal hemiacetal acetate reductase
MVGLTYRLGDSALKVSKVIMGCLSFGNKWQPWLLPQEKALPVLKYAYDNGINTFDMADTYSNGETERIFGAFLKEYDIPRHKVVILSKCFFNVADEDAPVAADTQGINDGNQVSCQFLAALSSDTPRSIKSD